MSRPARFIALALVLAAGLVVVSALRSTDPLAQIAIFSVTGLLIVTLVALWVVDFMVGAVRKSGRAVREIERERFATRNANPSE